MTEHFQDPVPEAKPQMISLEELENLGKSLTAEHREYFLSYREMARQMEINTNSIWRVENGKEVNYSTALRMIRWLAKLATEKKAQAKIKPVYSWDQPICAKCYDRRYPGRPPLRLIQRAASEHCMDCNLLMQSGIYIRVDPTTVKFPTATKEVR